MLLLFSCSLCGELLHINSPVPVEYLLQHQAFIVFEQVTDSLDLQISYTFYPRLRSLKSVNRGEADGDIGKASLAPSQLNNIFMVAQPIGQADVVAFYLTDKDKDKNIATVNDLSSFRVGYIKGWVFYERIAQLGKSAEPVMDATVLLRMLRAKRFDVVIIERGLGLFIANKLNFPAGSFTISKALATQGVHLFLHKKHKIIGDRLTIEFAKIKSKDCSLDACISE